jgi:hypothetical protein
VRGQAAIARDDLTMASAGLGLAEAREVLLEIQRHLITAQAAAAVAGRDCGSCGRARASKDPGTYGAAASLLSEAFPLGRTLQATAVRERVERTATRLKDEFCEERFSFIDTCPAEWEELPRPGLPLDR